MNNEYLMTGPLTRCCCAAWLLVLAPLVAVDAEQPLHEQVDQQIRDSLGEIQPGAPADDAEFLRRVYLDLAGRIPTTVEARMFLHETAEDKRANLIDQLLSGPDFPRRMRELFHAMLMERRGDDEAWSRFLGKAFQENMPWDEIVRAILSPNVEDEDLRGAAYFLTARLVSEGAMAPVDVPGLTRDVGRLLAGVDLQCAECHNHVDIDHYLQRDFQGLHMIFENVKTRRDVKFPAVSEALLTAEKDFMSVFTQEAMKTKPRVPGGGEFDIVMFPKDEEYLVPPDRKARTPGVPKFSPLAQLAAGLTARENNLFARNIANRLWFVMMGRGLIEPLDLIHDDNPPTHEALLDLLADAFVAHDYDIRWMLRELTLSRVYQRTSQIHEPQDVAVDAQRYAFASEKRLSAEQLFWSVLTANGELNATMDDAEPTESPATRSLEDMVASSERWTEVRKLMLDAFANAPKQPEITFEPSVKGALFWMHESRFQQLLEPQDGNLVERLGELAESEEIADELFLAILSRRAADEDHEMVAEYLAARKDRKTEAIRQLAWALFASTEFSVNH